MGKIPFDGNPLGYAKSGNQMPTSGLVFYAPLIDASATNAETGQALTYTNTFTAETFNGVQSLYTSGSRCITITDTTGMPTGNAPWTISIWMNGRGLSSGSSFNYAISMGKIQQYSAVLIGSKGKTIFQFGPGWYDYLVNGLVEDQWNNLVETYDGSTLKFYLNGNLLNSVSYSFNIVYSPNVLSIGGINFNGYQDFWEGNLAAARVYDRALTDDEITILANEFNQEGTITASDLSFSLYQKNETYGITYKSTFPPTFEITEGTLPNTISFNTSNGKFTGKGLTDADHTYNLKVKISAYNSTPVTVNVTIHTYKTARISLTGATWDFITEASSSKSISYTSDEPISEWSIDSGTLPTGVTFSNGMFTSTGAQSSAEQQTVTVRAKSANNQTGVTANYTLNVVMNVLTITTTSLKFYAGSASSKTLIYSTTNPITPVWTMTSGTLPSNVSYNDGVFTCDGLQTTDESATVGMRLESSTGHSTPDSKEVSLIVSNSTIPDPIITSGLIFYMPCNSIIDNVLGPSLSAVTGKSLPQYTTSDGIDCLYFNGDAALEGQDESYFIANDGNNSGAYTMCFWMKRDNALTLTTNGGVAFLGGKAGNYGASTEGLYIDKTDNSVHFMQGGHWERTLANPDSDWHFYTLQAYWLPSSTSYLKAYFDTSSGEADGRGYFYYIPSPSTIKLGCRFTREGNYVEYFIGYITRVKIYDRRLSEAEIAQLAAEFTPTT